MDANKRTALIVTAMMIRRSGYDLVLGDSERIDDIVVAVADGTVDFEWLVAWMKAHVVRT